MQLKNRGAWHSGLAKGEADVEGFLPDDEETFRQTQEFELQMSITVGSLRSPTDSTNPTATPSD
jgi:hypothetical protein